MRTKKSILVTGIHRSGSTWVGSVIAANTKVDSIVEPLNLNRIKRFQKFAVNAWNIMLLPDSKGHQAEETLSLYKFYRDVNYIDCVTHFFSPYENHSLSVSFVKRLRKASKPIKLFKDPTALFAAPFLVKKLNVIPVVLIRHPAAFVLSVVEKKWRFNFQELLKQPHFFEGHLKVYENEVVSFAVNDKEVSLIENASLAWKVFHAQILHYKNCYPEWYFVTHESLSMHPIEEYKKMFAYLQIPFTEKVRAYIDKSTQPVIETDRLRNAAKNSFKWKDIFNAKELETIYRITNPIASKFYDV